MPQIIGKVELPEYDFGKSKPERCTCCGASMPFGGNRWSDDVICDGCESDIVDGADWADNIFDGRNQNHLMDDMY